MQATAQAVAAFIGRGDDTQAVALAEVQLPIVTAFVKGYVGGHGFTDNKPNDDLSAVVVSAAARLVANPEQVERYAIGDYSETPAVLNGFTLPELAILHRYRRMTA